EHEESERHREFSHAWIDLICTTMREVEAKTGINPLHQKMEELFGPGRYFTDDGRECCDDCRRPEPAGPQLRDELWATIRGEAGVSVPGLHREAPRATAHASRRVRSIASPVGSKSMPTKHRPRSWRRGSSGRGARRRATTRGASNFTTRPTVSSAMGGRTPMGDCIASRARFSGGAAARRKTAAELKCRATQGTS